MLISQKKIEYRRPSLPADAYFANWEGSIRKEFKQGIDMSKFKGNQKWLIWCLEEF